MSFQVVEGDLFESGAVVLAHGCNTFGAMGAGIAVQFRERWPNMYEAYRKWCEEHEARSLHGSSWMWFNSEKPQVIACLFTQDEWTADPEMIRAAFRMLRRQMRMSAIKSVAFPAIGCGLAARDSGFTEEDLKTLCEELFGEEDEIEATLYVQ